MICLKMYTAKDYVDEDYDTEAYVMIEQKCCFQNHKNNDMKANLMNIFKFSKVLGPGAM